MDNIEFYPKGWEFRPRTRWRKKLLHGVGTNDMDYAPAVGKLKCPAYTTWNSMLERCYSKVYQGRFPTYTGCRTVKSWHIFSTFRSWYFEQRRLIGDYPGRLELDKDILSDSKTYSPRTAILIPQSFNSFLTDSAASRSRLPIGVARSGSKNYYARIGNGRLADGTMTQRNSQVVGTVEEAVKLRTKMKFERLDKIIPPWVDYDKVRRRCRKIIRNQK